MRKKFKLERSLYRTTAIKRQGVSVLAQFYCSKCVAIRWETWQNNPETDVDVASGLTDISGKCNINILLFSSQTTYVYIKIVCL